MAGRLGAGGLWARRGARRQARGRRCQPGRHLPAGHGLLPPGPYRPSRDRPHADGATPRARLVRRSRRSAVQPPGLAALRGAAREAVARGRALRSGRGDRLQHRSAGSGARQRDLSACRTSGFRADRGLYRHRPRCPGGIAGAARSGQHDRDPALTSGPSCAKTRGHCERSEAISGRRGTLAKLLRRCRSSQ